MPFYYFRVYCTEGHVIDEQGNEFLNDKRACVEAMRTARELAADEIVKGRRLEGMSFELARRDGSSIDKIQLETVAPPSLQTVNKLAQVQSTHTTRPRSF